MTVLDIAELYARLSKKESSKILASEELHNRNLQWLEDIQAEAKALFKKERKKDTEDVLLEGAETTNSNKEETELDDSGCSQIILLPKTPREIKARNARLNTPKPRLSKRPSFSTSRFLNTSRSTRNTAREAQSRIRSNLTEKLNKKKRRPTEPNGSKANISEYTSSYSTQDIHTTEDSVNSEGDNEVLLPARSSGYMTMSQEAKTLAETSNQPNIKSAEDRNDKEGVNPATSEISDEKEKKDYDREEPILPEKTETKFVENMSVAVICNTASSEDAVPAEGLGCSMTVGDDHNNILQNTIDKPQVSAKIPARVLRSHSSSSVTASETEDDVVVRRSTRNKKKPIQSPNHPTTTKKIKLTAPSPIKKALVPSVKVVNTPSLVTSKSVSLASLRHPNKAQNSLYSAIKDGKNCSTSTLIAAAKGASSNKANHSRKFTPQSPLKGVSTLSAALGKFGSGGQHYTSNTSSGASTLSKIRSRIGNVQKSPLKSATKSGSNILNIRSFLPQKPAKVPKETAEEIQAKKQEELNLKKQKADEAFRKKEEATKAKQEERRLQNEARQKRVHDAREAREMQKAHDRERVEKESKVRQDAIVKARQMAEERKRHEQEEKRKLEIENERIRLEKEKEKKLKEELEQKQVQHAEEEKKRREQERLKLRQLAAAEEERIKQENLQKQEVARQEQVKKAMGARINELNETYDVNGMSMKSPEAKSSNGNNCTFSKETLESQENYNITPPRHELPPEELLDEENYDIGDLRSDEDTDDEENPRKVIPQWAQGSCLRTTLMKQSFQPPDVNLIFAVQDATPDLTSIFASTSRRFTKRTSSAVWGRAPATHNLEL